MWGVYYHSVYMLHFKAQIKYGVSVIMNHQIFLFQFLKRLQQENEYIVFISINDYITEISETETPKNTTEYIIDDEKLPYNHPFK